MTCEHPWIETIKYNYTGKTYATCLICGEEFRSMPWLEHNILHDAVNVWYLKYVKTGAVELPLIAFIELENIIQSSSRNLKEV